jgi:hypothetical protein
VIKEGQMPRWIAEYKVESQGIIERETGRLVYRHPAELYEVHLSNNIDHDHPNETLNVHVIVSANDADEGDNLAYRHLHDFLDHLAFITAAPFSVSRQTYLLDWTPGIVERRCIVKSSIEISSLEEVLNEETLKITKH